MKIKSGFELREVCGENVILSHGVENIDFSKIISLNDSAAFVWKKAQAGDFTEAQLVEALCDEYEVEQPVAQADVHAIVEQWKQIGLVQE